MLTRWDAFGLRLAREVSLLSKDPSSKVGAYICDSMHRPVSFGFNGFPRGITDDARLENRELKYKMILHAEENAMINVVNDFPADSTVYTWPFSPCPHCASQLIQKGIRRIVAPDISQAPERWIADLSLAIDLFREAEVDILLVSSDDIQTL